MDYPRKKPNRGREKGVEDMEFPVVLKNKMEFLGLIKKKLFGISRGLGFRS